MKDNAGKHFAAHFFGHSQKHLRKCHGILKVIKGKLRKRPHALNGNQHYIEQV